MLLQVSVRELHNSLVSDPNDGGIKDATNEYDNIIISDSALHSLLPPQLKQMSERCKVMCGCECCISSKSIHSLFLSWCDQYLKKLKDQIQNAQSRRSSEKVHRIYKTYNNTVMPHVRHIYNKASGMSQDTMCAYPRSDHAIPHWKFVLRCCNYCPCINFPDQETDNQYSETTPSIQFHIYHIIARYTDHGIIPLKEKRIYVTCVNKNLFQVNLQKYTPEKS